MSTEIEYIHSYPRTTVIRRNGAVLIIDCGPGTTVAPDGNPPEMILLTSLDRDHTAGVHGLSQQATNAGANPRIIAPMGRADIPGWGMGERRWHCYDFRPSEKPLPLGTEARRVAGDGDRFQWCDLRFEVIGTPFLYESGVSYLFEVDSLRYCACGALAGGDGTVRDLYSLQRGFDTRDYHGFMGNIRLFGPSAARILSAGVDVLIPAYGPVVEGRDAVAELFREIAGNLAAVYANYISVSALNFYFPQVLETRRIDTAESLRLLDEHIGEAAAAAATADAADVTAASTSARSPSAPPGSAATLEKIEYLRPAPIREMPGWVRRIAPTSFVLLSKSGAGFLIDCGLKEVAPRWRRLAADTIGAGKAPDFIWITHYHDDHVDGLEAFVEAYSTPIESTPSVADVLTEPEACMLPCQCPAPQPVVSRAHGKTWHWYEFTLTALELPGQSLHHSGLLVEGRGRRILFAGDSFSPTGLDDYCAYNRNFPGRGQGFHRCLELIEELLHSPGELLIVNQHQPLPFVYDDKLISDMAAALERRREILTRLLPWPAPGFGTDPFWIRAYPYRQEVGPGSEFRISLGITNHGPGPAEIRAEPFIPHGLPIVCTDATPARSAIVESITTGSLTTGSSADGIPAGASPLTFRFRCRPGSVFRQEDHIREAVIPFRVWLDHKDAGMPCHGIISIIRPTV